MVWGTMGQKIYTWLSPKRLEIKKTKQMRTSQLMDHYVLNKVK